MLNLNFSHTDRGACVTIGDAVKGPLRHVSLGVTWGKLKGVYVSAADAGGERPFLYFRGLAYGNALDNSMPNTFKVVRGNME